MAMFPGSHVRGAFASTWPWNHNDLGSSPPIAGMSQKTSVTMLEAVGWKYDAYRFGHVPVVRVITDVDYLRNKGSPIVEDVEEAGLRVEVLPL